MTKEEFGKTIKKKYPQYNDLDDLDLAERILKKYPQYQDMISAEGAQPKKTFIEKTGDFLGLGGLARGIAGSIFQYTPEGKQALEDLKTGKITSQQYEEITKGIMPTNKEVIGSALQTAATIGTTGIAGGKILPTALKFGGTGAIAGFGKGMEENKTFRQSAQQAFLSGAISFGFAGAIGLAGKGIQKVLTKSPEKLYDSALKVNAKILRQGKSPSKVLIEDGTFGGLGKIMKESQEGIDEMNTAIAGKISKTNVKLKSKDIISKVLNKLKSKYGSAYSESELEAVIDSLPINELRTNKLLTLPQANILRQQLDNLVSGKFGQEVLKGSLKEKAIYHTTNILRNEIQKTTGTTNEFYKLSRYIKAFDLAEKAVAHADKYWGFGLRDFLIGGFGYLGGGIPGIGFGILSRATKEPFLKTGLAVGLNKLGQGIQKLPIEQMGRIGRTAGINLIKEVTNQ